MTYAGTVLAQSPHLYWRLGEASGDAQDETGNGHVGEEHNTPTHSATGLLTSDANTCFDFNGTDESVDIEPPALNAPGGFSFSASALFRADATTGSRVVMGRISASSGFSRSNNALWMVRIDAGVLHFWSNTNGTSGWVDLVGPAVSTGTTYHVACTFDVTTGIKRLYVDGALVATSAPTTIHPSVDSDGAGFSIANWMFGGAGAEWFDGRIDEVAFWHGVVLTGTQIDDQYDQSVNPTEDAPGPVTDLVVTAETCSTVSIAWSEPVTGGAPNGYRVRTDGGAPTDVGDVLDHTFTGLTPGTEYLFGVQAYNGTGDASWVEVTGTTDPLPGLPGGVAATVGATFITLTWTAAADATHYQVRINGGSPINDDDLSHAFTGLDSSTDYTVEVRACNDCGCSDWVSVEASTTRLIVPSACPCGPRWVVEATDLATGRIRAILMPTAADWQTILTDLGTGTLTFPARGNSMRDLFPDLTGVFISHINDAGEYDCQYAGYIERDSGRSTNGGGTITVGMRPIEHYWWRRFIDVDRTYTNTQQTQIAASLTSYAVTDGIPLVGIAEPSAITRNRTYVGAERPFIGPQLADLAAAEDGVEWTLVHTRANGYWSTQVVFQDRAGNDLNTVFVSDVDGAEYGLDIDATLHANHVTGIGTLPDGTQVITDVQTASGPYPRFDAVVDNGTVLDATNNTQQTAGYLATNAQPIATPTFTLIGDDPDPTGVRLGDTGTFRIAQGAIRFNGRARIWSISSRIAMGEPWKRTLGLTPVDGAAEAVLNS